MDQRVGINLLIHCTYQVFILGHRNAKVWCPMHTIAPSEIIVWSFCAQVPLNKSHFHRNCAWFTTTLNLSLNSLVKKQSLKQFKVHCWTSFFIFLMRKYPLDKKFIICSNLLFIAVLTYFWKNLLVFGMAAMPFLCKGLLLNRFNLPRFTLLFNLKLQKVH